MEKYYQKARILITSSTARDTGITFIGNAISAFSGFLFVMLSARFLSVSDFGIYSAAENLLLIIFSLTDFGLSSAIVNFVSIKRSRDKREDRKYMKSAFLIRFIFLTIASSVLLVGHKYLSEKLLGSSNSWVIIWVAISLIGMVSWGFSPFVLKARRKFTKAVISDVTLRLGGLLAVLVLVVTTGLTLAGVLGAYFFGIILTILAFFTFVGTGFLKERVPRNYFIKLMKFSGWLGVYRVVTSIAGRLDVQMLAAYSGATTTGLYSIPSKLSLFIVTLSVSYSTVLATRLASFSDKKREKKYIKKSIIAIIPLVGTILIWIALAKPFIYVLFGERYLEAVPVFQLLSLSTIPLLLSMPAFTAMVYSMKRTRAVGLYAIVNLLITFVLNSIFIPKFGILGPTIAFGIVYSIYAVFMWSQVIRYYWLDKQ